MAAPRAMARTARTHGNSSDTEGVALGSSGILTAIARGFDELLAPSGFEKGTYRFFSSPEKGGQHSWVMSIICNNGEATFI